MTRRERLERLSATDDTLFRHDMIKLHGDERERLELVLARLDAGTVEHDGHAQFRSDVVTGIAAHDEAIRLWSQPA